MTTRHMMYLLALLMAVLVTSLWSITWVATRPRWYYYKYNNELDTVQCISGLTHAPDKPFFCEAIDPKPVVHDYMWFSGNDMILPGYPWSPARCEDGIAELTRDAPECRNSVTQDIAVDPALCVDPKPKTIRACGLGFDSSCHWSAVSTLSWDECVAQNKFTYVASSQTCVPLIGTLTQDIGIFSSPSECWQSVKDKVLVRRYVIMEALGAQTEKESDRVCVDLVTGASYVDMINCSYDGSLVW